MAWVIVLDFCNGRAECIEYESEVVEDLEQLIIEKGFTLKDCQYMSMNNLKIDIVGLE